VQNHINTHHSDGVADIWDFHARELRLYVNKGATGWNLPPLGDVAKIRGQQYKELAAKRRKLSNKIAKGHRFGNEKYWEKKVDFVENEHLPTIKVPTKFFLNVFHAPIHFLVNGVCKDIHGTLRTQAMNCQKCKETGMRERAYT